jgi:type III restriction enzyme
VPENANPILNSPYPEPLRHFGSDERGVTDQVIEGRRPSSFYIPVPRAKTRGRAAEQNVAEGAYGAELQKENDFVNRLRGRVGRWRADGYPGLTKASRDLLAYWNGDDRASRLFFCQIEALETIMWLNEVAEKSGDAWAINELKDANAQANPKLSRLALKMATGSGKTVVMAMLVAYHTINKAKYPQETRFTDAFVVVAPGITIRDRLNVLLPNDPDNYYRKRDIVPPADRDLLQRAVVHIINFHQLECRQNPRYQVGAVMKAAGLIDEQVVKETPAAMVSRVFKPMLGKPRVLVINDEAHHCYREKPTDEKLVGEDRKEADENNEAARVWISGLEALAEKMEVAAVVDLSATPYFLRGSGYQEGTLFPWVVSDFSLLDALECGVVKIPRLPVATDNLTAGDQPEFRNLWLDVRDVLPKKNVKTGEYDLTKGLPSNKLELALESLYGSYKKYYARYEADRQTNADVMPPVMIVVCSNTTVSELVYRWIAGYERETPSGKSVIEKGHLDIFRNEDGFQMLEKPNTLIIDSAQLESGEKIDDAFKGTFAAEIEDFRKDYAKRFPGREEPTDEQILREVMNTVGKPGKLGENIKCVVSVSMLTEGWDVNTVTHVLGVRAFSTQLLCEQVVGRALRRVDYEPDENGLFRPEYAEVYGVPFSFLRIDGDAQPQPPKVVHRVRALEERAKYEIKFPRVEGYRYEVDEARLSAKFSEELRVVIENEPTQVEIAGAIGEGAVETLDTVRDRREGTVVQYLVRGLLRNYYTDADGQEKYWLAPQLTRIAQEFVRTQIVLKDRMAIGYLSIGQYLASAVTKIQQAIVAAGIAAGGERKVLPIYAAYDAEGSTRYVDFLTTKPVAETAKSHVNYVVADTAEWEQGVAKRLEGMSEVLAYVKNQTLGFYIPYEHAGVARQYVPDFIATLSAPDGSIVNLIIEVTGKKDDKKGLKTRTARELWVPAVNNDGKYGRWAFLEVQDIHEVEGLIRAGLANGFDLSEQ